MKQTPQIRLVFTLTRRDRADFDRDAVTRGLGILPTRSCPPTPGKGKVQHCGKEIREPDEQVLPGFTVLPAEAPPYPTLRHAYWSAELPKMDSLKPPLCSRSSLRPRQQTAALSRRRPAAATLLSRPIPSPSPFLLMTLGKAPCRSRWKS